MKKLFSLLVFLIPLGVSAQYNPEYFRIGNVQQSWSTQNGSLDSVRFEVKPKGLYAEVGMYFDISTRGTSYAAGDSLEIQMLFNLPDQVEVTDMWLWINDSIIRADMYDKWTASHIYEEIVDRRVDPAILYKYTYYDYYGSVLYDNLYMFRIFPLMTNLPRKAKITYLVPIQNLNSKNPQISLPINILKLSSQPISSVKVNYYPDQNLLSPGIVENSSLVFTSQTDTAGEAFLGTSLSVSGINTLTLNLNCNTPSDSRIGIYNDVQNGEKFYQMQIIPNNLFGLKKSKKALILFDYVDNLCMSMNSNDVLSGLRNAVKNNFQIYDSINIMFSGMITQTVSPDWIPTDSSNINNLFNSLSGSNFNPYSSLPGLLLDGVQYIQSHGNDGTIILISSSNSNGTSSQANNLLGDLLTLMDSVTIPIHVIDLDDYNYSNEAQYIGGQYYYGNEYLYVNLSMLTGGDYLSLQEHPYSEMLVSMVGKLSGYFTSFDLYTTLESGYTYSNYRLKNNLGLTFFDYPLQQVGKVFGSGRFHLIASAQDQEGTVYHSDLYINLSEIDTFDYATREIWAGQYIRELQSFTQSNLVINQIINTSIEERVLSNYTAFLALEPGLGLLDDQNSGNQTGMEDQPQASSDGLLSFPNPCRDKATLRFELTENTDVRIEVYNLFGMLLSVISDEYMVKGSHDVEISTADLPAGNYLIRMVTGNEKVSVVKITVMH